MEDEKKKKRNKKKKNKQTKTTEEDAIQNQNNDVGGSQNGDVACNGEVDLDKHLPNGAIANSVEEIIKELQKENESHVQKEASLQETIKHLKEENESHIQKEASLEETIKQLRNEFDSHVKKEGSLEETILTLQLGNDSHLQKEASLKETIQQLQYESESHMQEVAGLEKNILELRSEKELWLQEKANLEEKISQLLEEKAALDLKGANLEEKIKQLEEEKESWIQTEKSTREAISALNRDITRLKVQVVELEDSRSNLSRENQQLTENISGLQLHSQNLERNVTSGPSSDEFEKQTSEHEDLNSQIEAAGALVDKLIMENAELVEKVNELYVKLEQRGTAAVHASTTEIIQMDKVTETAGMSYSIPESVGSVSTLAPKLDSIEATPIHNEKINGEKVVEEPVAPISTSIEAEDSGEIVQIPLDDTDVRDLAPLTIDTKEQPVPLTDAPLIGAPFRLISFVASYVSGADLVNND